MKTSGIVRKIDELGRIVIPKEIRNSLNIKDQESIEIVVENDSVILKKHYKMNRTIDNINKYIKIFEHLSDAEFLVTDREKVIGCSSKINAILNLKVTNELNTLVDSRKQIISKTKEKVSIVEGIIFEKNYILTPIIVNADLLGSVICLKETTLKETDVLSNNIINYLIKEEF